MTKLDAYETNGSSPPEVRESEARASRIHSLLKLRKKADDEIAAVLSEHLKAVGEPAWLAWCEREFGWGRSTAYLHLDPTQLEAKRERDRERQANVRDSRTPEPVITDQIAPPECEFSP